MRAVGRRRALPSGRAVAGGFFVAAAAVLLFGGWLAARPSPGRLWVVAARPLAAGTTFQAGDLARTTIRLPGQTAALAYRLVAPLLGRTLAAPLRPGELVQADALVPVGRQPALRPVSVSVDPTGLDQLEPGTSVDVLVTQGSDQATTARMIVRAALVIRVDTASSGLVGASTTSQVTLGVTTLAEVEALVQGSHSGTLTLVVAEPSDGRGLGPGPVPGAGSGAG